MTIPRKHHLDRRADRLQAEGGSDDEMLSTADVASWLGISIQFLEIGRSRGFGPPFKKLSPRCIRYQRGDVRKWLRARTHASTAEYRNAQATA
jgi:hypothetical protein